MPFFMTGSLVHAIGRDMKDSPWHDNIDHEDNSIDNDTKQFFKLTRYELYIEPFCIHSYNNCCMIFQPWRWALKTSPNSSCPLQQFSNSWSILRGLMKPVWSCCSRSVEKACGTLWGIPVFFISLLSEMR